MKAALAAMMPPDPRHPPMKREGRPKGLNALGTFARYPRLAQAWNTFNGHILLGSSLTARERELVILRVASLRDAEYEWAQHEVIAGDVGLSPEDVKRIVEGPEADGWSPIDRAMLRATDELVRDAFIADATWTVLRAELDDERLMDLVFTIGAYDLLAMMFKSFGVELDDDLRK